MKNEFKESVLCTAKFLSTKRELSGSMLTMAQCCFENMAIAFKNRDALAIQSRDMANRLAVLDSVDARGVVKSLRCLAGQLKEFEIP